jgi:hypothetical protein
MITDTVTNGDRVTAWAEFSPERTHRFTLGRLLDCIRPERTCVFVMLNPSTADAFKLDPTVARCAKFAHRWGFSVLEVANLFALRTPKPAELRRSAQRYVYQDVNHDRVVMLALQAQLVVCAWGADTFARDTAAYVRTLLQSYNVKLHALGFNPDGSPRHPAARGRSRVPDSAEPVPWA